MSNEKNHEQAWTSLTCPKTTHAKFATKAKQTGYSIVRILDIAGDYIAALTPTQISDLMTAKNNPTAQKARKKAGAV